MRRMEKMKKVWSVLLAISMVLSRVPVPAWAAETVTDPAVCTCGTDDAAIHATNCPVYAAPENPACHCAQKCTETNVWCDICGFDYTVCHGNDQAKVYLTNPTPIEGIVYNGTPQVLINPTPPDEGYVWGYASYGRDADPLFVTPETYDPPRSNRGGFIYGSILPHACGMD